MNDALGNHRYVIYMKKEDFAQHENTQKWFTLVTYNILLWIYGEQTIPSWKKKNGFVMIFLNYLMVGSLKTGSNCNE